MPPTLFIKGKLKAHEYSPSQSTLDKYTPIDYIMDFFKGKIGKGGPITDKILICESSTGSGKSTVIPPEFYHRYYSMDNRNIACTQPRVMNAISLPKNDIIPFNTKEYFNKNNIRGKTPLVMGDNIGYQTGSFVQKPASGIVYMQIGVLQGQLNSMSDKQFMNKYSIIFIDEAHERSLFFDNVIMSLKRLIHKYHDDPKCPFLVVMSATLETKLFCDYLFPDLKPKDKYKNIIKVEGNSHPIERHYLEYNTDNVINECVQKVIQIHKEFEHEFLDTADKIDDIDTDENRDILIFVAGGREQKKIQADIMKQNNKNEYLMKYPLLALGLNRGVIQKQGQEYIDAMYTSIHDLKVKIGKKYVPAARRVIIGTNAIETGVTIETLKHVVDPGFVNSAEFNPSFNFTCLINKPTSQNSITQRMGRVGRVSPGNAWHLYTRESYEKLNVAPYPEILVDVSDSFILSVLMKYMDEKNDILEMNMKEINNGYDQMKKCEVNFHDIDFFTPPSNDSLMYSINKLYTLGGIDNDMQLTITGILMSKFNRFGPEQIKMLLAGYAWGAPVQDLITIACFLNHKARDVYKGYMPHITAMKAMNIYGYRSKKSYIISSCEFTQSVILLEHFKDFMADLSYDFEEKMGKWAKELSLDYEVLLDIIAERDALMSQLANMGLDPFYMNHKKITTAFSSSDLLETISTIKQCIMEGYKNNIAKRNMDGTYTTMMTDITFNYSHPLLRYEPTYIVFNELFGMPGQKGITYELNPQMISILDGYISIDVWFDSLI